jgi:hypothetical protein
VKVSGMNFARRPNGQRSPIRLDPLTRGRALAKKVRDGDVPPRLILYSIGKYHLGLIDEITHTEVHMLVAVPGA